MHKMEELLAATKLKAMLRKAEDQKKSKVCWIVISILAVLAVAGVAYALYKYFTPKYYDEFDDELCDDDFDDEFFEEIES